MIEQNVKIITSKNNPVQGNTGYRTQAYGLSATVSNLANATGGSKAGNLVKPSI